MRTVFEVIQHRLEQRIEAAVGRLSEGAAADYAEYKDLCGLIRGLRAAQIELQDLAQTMKDQDD